MTDAHEGCVKFNVMVSVSFLNCLKCTDSYFVLDSYLFVFLFFFHPADIDLFTFSTLMPEMMWLILP